MTQTEDRIVALETALTHQESVVQDLNEIVLDFATRIERLERQALAMAARLAAAESESPGSGADDRPPPHW